MVRCNSPHSPRKKSFRGFIYDGRNRPTTDFPGPVFVLNPLPAFGGAPFFLQISRGLGALSQQVIYMKAILASCRQEGSSMAQRGENRSIDDAVERLEANGFNGLAEAVTTLISSASCR